MCFDFWLQIIFLKTKSNIKFIYTLGKFFYYLVKIINFKKKIKSKKLYKFKYYIIL
jgi:hypothetical protein